MGDEIEALRHQYEEAKSRLIQQRDTFKTFSNEGVAVIRVLVLLVTAPAAVLGAFNYSTLVELVRFIGSNTQIGVFLTYPVPAILVTGLAVTGLVLALVMHTLAAGFDARGIRTTTNPNDIHVHLEEDWSESKYIKRQLNEYVDRIDQNDRVLNELENLLTAGKLGLAALMMSVSAYVSYMALEVQELAWIPLLFVIPYVVYRRIPENYRRADSGGKFTPPYETEYQTRLDRLSTDKSQTGSKGDKNSSKPPESGEQESNSTNSTDQKEVVSSE